MRGLDQEAGGPPAAQSISTFSGDSHQIAAELEAIQQVLQVPNAGGQDQDVAVACGVHALNVPHQVHAVPAYVIQSTDERRDVYRRL
jgi:hypothetical protein